MSEIINQNWNPQIPDQKVREIYGGIIGKTTGIIKEHPLGLTISVNLGPNNVKNFTFKNLELVSESETIRDILTKGYCFSEPLFLRQLIIAEKISNKYSPNINPEIEVTDNFTEKTLIIYQKKKQQDLIHEIKPLNVSFQELKSEDLLEILKDKNSQKNSEIESKIKLISLESIRTKTYQEQLENLLENKQNNLAQVIFYKDISALNKKDNQTYKLFQLLAEKLGSDQVKKVDTIKKHPENNLLNLIKFGDNIKEQKLLSQDNVKKIEITPEELKQFVEDHFETQYFGTPREENKEHLLALDLELSAQAKNDLSLFCEQFKPPLKTFLPYHKVTCVFKSNKELVKNAYLEEINDNHPLIQWITSRIKNGEFSFVKVCSMELELQQIKDKFPNLKSGGYFYLIYNINQSLVYQVINIESQELLEQKISEQLIIYVSQKSETSIRIFEKIDQEKYYICIEKYFPSQNQDNILSAGIILCK